MIEGRIKNRNIVVDNCKISNCYRNGITINSADGVLIQNSTICNIHGNPGSTVHLEDQSITTRNVTIRDCILYNSDCGISLYEGSGHTVDNCVIRGCGTAIWNRGSWDINIINCKIYNCYDINLKGNTDSENFIHTHGSHINMRGCYLYDVTRITFISTSIYSSVFEMCDNIGPALTGDTNRRNSGASFFSCSFNKKCNVSMAHGSFYGCNFIGDDVIISAFNTLLNNCYVEINNFGHTAGIGDLTICQSFIHLNDIRVHGNVGTTLSRCS